MGDLIIRNGAKTISLPTLFRKLNKYIDKKGTEGARKASG